MSVFVRILLRVIAGILIGKGLPPDAVEMVTSDTDVMVGVEVILGAVVWGGTEIFYFMAKKFGWKT